MFEERPEARERRIREMQARAKADRTRRAMLRLLAHGSLTSAELRAGLGAETPTAVVNYHLGVLVNVGAVVAEGDRYRLT